MHVPYIPSASHGDVLRGPSHAIMSMLLRIVASSPRVTISAIALPRLRRQQRLQVFLGCLALLYPDWQAGPKDNNLAHGKARKPGTFYCLGGGGEAAVKAAAGVAA